MTQDPFKVLAEASAQWGEPLDEAQMKAIGLFGVDVRRNSLKANLTAPRDLRTLLFRHVADGLAAVPLLRSISRGIPHILDLGSGAGYIGVAVKIAWPEAPVTLMESRRKRFAFLSGAAARLGHKGLLVVRHRAGETSHLRGAFDIVIERALSKLPKALETALPMIKEGGCLAAYVSQPPAEGLAPASARLIKCHRYRLPEESKDRFLAVFQKTEKET